MDVTVFCHFASSQFGLRERHCGSGISNDLPPWFTIHQQARCWMKAGCFEAMAHDLRAILRLAAGKEA